MRKFCRTAHTDGAVMTCVEISLLGPNAAELEYTQSAVTPSPAPVQCSEKAELLKNLKGAGAGIAIVVDSYRIMREISK
jgi:hypothetical protein